MMLSEKRLHVKFLEDSKDLKANLNQRKALAYHIMLWLEEYESNISTGNELMRSLENTVTELKSSGSHKRDKIKYLRKTVNYEKKISQI